jgi:hypothetical protein
MSDLGWLKPVDSLACDSTFKPFEYLPIYEKHFNDLRDKPFTLLEIGIWKGESLLMWAKHFPQATIVGIDLQVPQRDWPENVHTYQCNQTDLTYLSQIAKLHAPSGFDVIIDDASHVGALTCDSINHLFKNHLKYGGLYFIEDWGTGYWSRFSDGQDIDTPLSLCSDSNAGHGFGMVGLVKRLIDHVGRKDIPADYRGEALEIESMQIHLGLVALKKSDCQIDHTKLD